MLDSGIWPFGDTLVGYAKYTKRFGGCFLVRLVDRRTAQTIAQTRKPTMDAAKEWLEQQAMQKQDQQT